MTDQRALSLSWSTPEPGVAGIAVTGDLDYDSADTLIGAVTARLGDDVALRELRIDCAGLGHCDSYGLASLLMIRRRSAGTGVTLHLDDRPQSLDRLLRITRTLEHLTGDGVGVREEQFDS